jgi:hypothetical protein
MGLLSRLRTGRSRPARRILPSAGVIRRERSSLRRLREEKLRDLGGLMLEMYRRDVFREDLLAERCNELLGLDARLRELEDLLAAARHRVPLAQCDCGAPLPWGSHFCPNCGRPAGEQPVIACSECGHPLPADARFCASCGAASSSEEAPDQETTDGEPEPGAAAAEAGEDAA